MICPTSKEHPVRIIATIEGQTKVFDKDEGVLLNMLKIRFCRIAYRPIDYPFFGLILPAQDNSVYA